MHSRSYQNFDFLCGLLRARYESDADCVSADPRLVVVFGAGGSSWFEFSEWNKMQELILETAENCFAEQYRGSLYEKMWEHVSPTAGLPHISPTAGLPGHIANLRKLLLAEKSITTDMLAGAACQDPIARDAIAEFLTDHFKKAGGEAGPRPVLAAELLAHMVNHRLIDHVVSFNFDEILDRSFENEMGPDGFDRIISADSPAVDSAVKKPRLIKLHGSVCTPSTLRFTDTHLGVLPRRLISVLDRTLLGRDRQRSAILLSLGYGWRDRGFVNWVNSRISRIKNIIIIRKREEVPSGLDPSKTRVISTEELSNIPGRPLTVDRLLWSMYNHINDIREPPLPPIARHLVLAYLFGRPFERNGKIQYRNEHAIKKRLRAELLLHGAKQKGMVNTRVLSEDIRLARYVTGSEAGGISPDDLWRCLEHDFVRSDGEAASATFFSRASTIEELAGRFLNTDEQEFDFEHAPGGGLHGPRVPEVDPGSGTVTLPEERTDPKEFLESQVRAIFREADTEVVRDRDPQTPWHFRRARPLTTHSALRRSVVDIVGDEWTHLFVVTEWSSWMREILARLPESESKERSVFVIEPSTVGLEQWELRESALSGRLDLLEDKGIVGELRIAHMPWSIHNRHFVLALKDVRFLGGTYSWRYLKASQISPLYVSNPLDCAELFRMFLGYLHELDASSDREFIRSTLDVADRVLEHYRPDDEMTTRLASALASSRAQLAREVTNDGRSRAAIS